MRLLLFMVLCNGPLAWVVLSDTWDSVTHERRAARAAAIPEAFLTAYRNLFDLGGLVAAIRRDLSQGAINNSDINANYTSLNKDGTMFVFDQAVYDSSMNLLGSLPSNLYKAVFLSNNQIVGFPYVSGTIDEMDFHRADGYYVDSETIYEIWYAGGSTFPIGTLIPCSAPDGGRNNDYTFMFVFFNEALIYDMDGRLPSAVGAGWALYE